MELVAAFSLQVRSCSSVSTPSAVVATPRLLQRPVTARTMASDSWVLPRSWMKLLSNLILVGCEGTERGVAGSKIVHDDEHADGAELVKGGLGGGDIAHHGCFGDLELKARRLEIASLQHALDPLGKASRAELCRREILIEMVRSSVQPAASAQAVRRTQSPISTVMSCSSAKGMKSAGGMEPRVGLDQRMRAS